MVPFQVIIGGACGSSAINSMITGAAPALMWGILNGLQLLVILPLTNAFLPDSILEFIYGIEFATFSFDFVPINTSPVYKQIDEWLHFDQEEDVISSMGIESTSSIVNNFQIITTFLLIGLVNLCVLPFYLKSRK
jgi:hypothetical protein